MFRAISSSTDAHKLRHTPSVRTAALTLACAALVAASASAAHHARPRLVVTSTAPFTVRGVHFFARERVTVLASVRGRHVRRARANVHGVFIARFRGLTVGGCDSYFVRATGNLGSSATLKLMVECAPEQALDDLHPIDPNPKRR